MKLYFDKDKETEWLNNMARRGWAATSFFAGVYTLEPCAPGEYLYQIDIVPKGQEEDFREFMEQMGVELVCRWSWWMILRRKSAQGSFEMYSDGDSKMRYYRKIAGILFIMVIIVTVCVLVSGFITFKERDPLKLALCVLQAGIYLALLRTLLNYCGKIKKLHQGGVKG